MSREKNLAKNTGIIAIGQLSSKFFTFLLLPLYTSVLLPEDYGTVDVLLTFIGLVMYIVTLQIESAIFRFIIDDRKDKENISDCISVSISLVLVNLIIATLIIYGINYIHSISHVTLFVLCLWAEAFSLICKNVSRGLGHNGLFSLSSFVVTIVSLLVNIVFILAFHLGAKSILIAFILSNIAGNLIIVFKERLWQYIRFSKYNVKKLKEMLKYSVPLVPNAISWWVANTSDRLLILCFLGSAMNGIYAAANKIPTIYTTIFTVYNMAWTESVSLAINDNDRDSFINSMMDKSYKALTFLALGLICGMSLFFNFLIGKNYSDAYIHIYILIVAIFINSMCSLLGGIFTGFKKSKIIGTTTVIGALVNFAFNLAFIKFIGLYAASISTLLSYLIIFCIRKHYSDKLIKLKWSLKYTVQVIIALVVVTFGYFTKSYLLNSIILVLLIVWGTFNNKSLVLGFVNTIKGKFLKK